MTTPTGLNDTKQPPEIDKKCENCKWWHESPTNMYHHQGGLCKNVKSKRTVVTGEDSCEYHEPRETKEVDLTLLNKVMRED